MATLIITPEQIPSATDDLHANGDEFGRHVDDDIATSLRGVPGILDNVAHLAENGAAKSQLLSIRVHAKRGITKTHPMLE